MFKVTPKTLIILSGVIWFTVGLSLLRLGLKLVALNEEASAIIWIALALAVGYLKGRFILKKSAERELRRIHGLSMAVSIYQLYSPKYYLLLVLMMGFGLAFNFFGLDPTIRGVIDTAIGTALLSGSFAYLRAAIYGMGSLCESRMPGRSAPLESGEPIDE